MNTILICLIVCSIYCFILYKIVIHRINKKIDNKSFLKSVKEEINSLITQINETSDRNVLLIENRLERLSNAVADADKRLNSFKKEINKEILTPASDIKEIKKKPISLEIIETEDNIFKESVSIKSNELEDDNTLPRRDRILLLHRQGISPSIIASQTNATIGEVELIISLSRS